jgi:hypothetical protein
MEESREGGYGSKVGESKTGERTAKEGRAEQMRGGQNRTEGEERAAEGSREEGRRGGGSDDVAEAKGTHRKGPNMQVFPQRGNPWLKV